MQSNPSSAPVSRQKSNSMSKGSDQQKPDRKTLTSRLSGIFGFSKRKNVTNADDDDDVSEQNEKDIPIKDPERQKAIEAEVAAAEKERQRIHAEKEEAARVLALEQEKLRQAEEALKEQHAREARLRLQEETISNALRDIVRVRADTDHASQERFQQQLTAKLVEESKANEVSCDASLKLWHSLISYLRFAYCEGDRKKSCPSTRRREISCGTSSRNSISRE